MTDYSLQGKRIWVAGHRGMAGSAVVRRLAAEDCEVITAGREIVDLRRQVETESWLQATRPEVVVLAAATVGGIHANDTRPAEFMHDNLAIQDNVIHGSYLAGVEKLLFLGSSCIYPRLAPQPMQEEALLTGPLEPTNQWYAVAKIAGVKMYQAYRRQYGCDFISAMPTNLFGPGDNFDVAQGHVAAGLMVKIHAAKASGAPAVEVWGSGRPLREFLYVDDLADALVFLLKHYSDEPHVNVGTGSETSIAELARTIAKVVGYSGAFTFDTAMPDGSPRKVMDSSRLAALGWTARTSLEEGLARAYAWYLAHRAPSGD